MAFLIAIVTGVLFAAGIFCLLRRTLTKVMIGIILLSQSVNMLVFSAGGLVEQSPAFVPTGAITPAGGAADPVPQALVLTAIVIGFGLVVFSLALLMRAYRALGVDDLDSFSETDRIS